MVSGIQYTSVGTLRSTVKCTLGERADGTKHFYSKLPSKMNVLVLQTESGTFLYIINLRHKKIVIPDLTQYSEEQMFQESLVWDFPDDIRLVRAILEEGLYTVQNFSGASEWEQTFEY
jgi:hypothetical protein